MRAVVTGGGTGGHLSIADALADALVSRGHHVHYVGSTSGQDRQWFEGDERFESVRFLPTSGVVNRRGLGRAASLWRVFKAAIEMYALLKKLRADVVISVGGFSAAPAALAALSLRLPLFIHEQNAVPGRLNAMLKPYAKGFFSSYDAASPVRAYPLKHELFERARVRNEVRTLIFLGGSQGATAINDLALALAPELKARSIAIVHQAGANDEARVRAAYEALGVEAEVFGFVRDLPERIARADMAVSRAGASTLWELSANGLSAFYVPYPYAAGDHQYHNARFLSERGLGWVRRQSELSPEDVLAALDEGVAGKSEALTALASPDAAVRIVETIEESVHAG